MAIDIYSKTQNEENEGIEDMRLSSMPGFC